MKKILLTLLLIGNLFSQANNLLTLSPSAHTSAIGNVMLPMMSPARNHIDSDRFTFTRVNWLGNIVDDMNYMFFNLSKGSFDFHTLLQKIFQYLLKVGENHSNLLIFQILIPEYQFLNNQDKFFFFYNIY